MYLYERAWRGKKRYTVTILTSKTVRGPARNHPRLLFREIDLPCNYYPVLEVVKLFFPDFRRNRRIFFANWCRRVNMSNVINVYRSRGKNIEFQSR